MQQYASPGSISDKRVAIDLIIVKETPKRVHGMIRWCPTWLQLADALTKESADAMDILRGAIVSCKYHLHAESTVMEAAADQRQRRLAKRQGPHAEPSAQASQVFFVASAVVSPSMVKVDANRFKQAEVRALFECMVSSFVADGEEFEKHMIQNKSMCKIRVPANFVDAKTFRSDEVLVTFAYYKTTGMITVFAGAVFLDGAERMLKGVLKAYESLLTTNEVSPLPEGATMRGQSLKMIAEQGVQSVFLEESAEQQSRLRQ